MTTSGRRDKLVKIIRLDEPRDFEEFEVPEKLVCECWAHIRPASAKELEYARAVEQQITHMVEIDFPFVNIQAKDIVRFEDRELNITGVVNPDEADRELQLACIEVAS